MNKPKARHVCLASRPKLKIKPRQFSLSVAADNRSCDQNFFLYFVLLYSQKFGRELMMVLVVWQST